MSISNFPVGTLIAILEPLLLTLPGPVQKEKLYSERDGRRAVVSLSADASRQVESALISAANVVIKDPRARRNALATIKIMTRVPRDYETFNPRDVGIIGDLNR